MKANKTLLPIAGAVLAALGLVTVLFARARDEPPSSTSSSRSAPAELSQAERDALINAALSDSRVKDLIGVRTVTDTGVGEWESGGELVGGVVHILFAEPETLTGEWLSWRHSAGPAPGKHYPPSLAYPATYTNVKDLTVLVDLTDLVPVHIQAFGDRDLTAELVGTIPPELQEEVDRLIELGALTSTPDSGTEEPEPTATPND